MRLGSNSSGAVPCGSGGACGRALCLFCRQAARYMLDAAAAGDWATAEALATATPRLANYQPEKDEIVAAGPAVRERSPEEQTQQLTKRTTYALLHWAAASGDLALLSRLLSLPGVDVRLTTRGGQRASIVAMAHDKPDAALACYRAEEAAQPPLPPAAPPPVAPLSGFQAPPSFVSAQGARAAQLYLEEAQENEAAQEAQEATDASKAERKALLKAASLPDMEALFEEVMVKGDGDIARLRSHPLMQEPLTQLKEQVDQASEEFVAAVLEFHTAKTQEHAEFSTALGKAKGKSGNDSKAEIAKYKALKKRSLAEVTGGEQPQATVQALQEANAALYEKLMDLEMGAAERYVETISQFESAYDELSKKTLEASTNFFQRLRDLEAAYHERLLAAGTELLEKMASQQGEVEGLSEEGKMLAHDKDTLFGALNTAHDARISRLDAKEDEVRLAEERAFGKIVLKALDDEYLRNRTRVTEIWNLVHNVHGSELSALGAARDDE